MNTKILVLGAGAIGGYFGGRLVEAGQDVTFLVRLNRKKQIEGNGGIVVINSVNGNYTFKPTLITKEEGDGNVEYDVVLLSSKSYHLQASIEDLKPFIGKNTLVIPLLNGIQHISILEQAFGRERVLGGLCVVETTLNDKGEIHQPSELNQLIFGQLDGGTTEKLNQLAQAFGSTKAKFTLSESITQDMWNKYLMITTMSSITTLMRTPLGTIRDSVGGLEFIESVFKETESIMRANGAPLSDGIVDRYMTLVKTISSQFKTSMQRDMEKGLEIEGDHIQGYILQLAKQHNISAPLLRCAYQNLCVYNEMLKARSNQ
ncbi:hypothetical protein CYY_004906 [Polysphondylium violaceum]|uniref:2-dehydropantoate 2-reductase n=1 Tax=Polysphondylium violaceum TaxID=133409 RepID=A0A8J4V4Q1_9MYCE|nr:hypothetical protein CYY_004906 [Polysphondylium violaceum]